MPAPSVRATVALITTLALTAGSVATPARGYADEEEARPYLRRMAQAAQGTYEARKLVVYLDAPQSAAVLEVRNGPEGRYVRSDVGGDVTRLWRRPGWGLISGASGSLEDDSAPPPSLDPSAILEKYAVDVGDPTTMLGVDLVPLELERRKDRQPVERLWVDPDTGVVYRREQLAPDGSVRGLSTVLEMDWGEVGRSERPDDEAVSREVERRRSADAPDRLPYGYELVRTYEFETEDHRADHWVYSDGLHLLSVFRTPGRMSDPNADRYERVEVGGTDMWTGPGPGTWIWEGDGSTWVVLAEETQLDPATVTERFPRGGPSILSRLASWWVRGWDWLVDRFR